MNVEKSISITGNLSEGPLKYICYPRDEFSATNSYIAIAAVVFDSHETISVTCKITTNFVTSKKRGKDGNVLVYEEPLNFFHLKTSPNSQRGIFRFGK